MEIKCELCGEKIVVADDLVPGQHVRCPFCDGKFSYAVKPKEITEDDLREAIAICRKNDEWNKYYKNAPAGAKLYIALVFYGKVFASTLDKAAFVEAFKGIGPELKERDLRYLLQHEDDEVMREYLSDRLASVCGGMTEAGERTLGVKPLQSLPAGGAVVSRRVAKPAKVLRMRNGTTPNASCRMNSQSQTNWTGVLAAVTVVLAVVCVGIFLYRVWVERQEDEKHARIAEAARIKAVDDKRKQLNDCVNNAGSEVKSLQKKLALAVIAVDRDKARFKDEMAKIETENNLRAGSARTKGRMRFNAAELAMAIFKSPIFGGIYERYMEQSLAGKAAEAKARILAEIGGRSTFSQDEVDGIDVIGNAYVKSANKEILNALDAGRKKVAALKEEVKKLKSVVQDAEDVAKGTDLKQMNDAKARMEELKCSELAKKLDRFVVVMREMSIVKMPEDEFVVREETNMVANISREGISATSVPETEPENTAENSLPQSKEKEAAAARISAPKQKLVAKPSKEIVNATKKTKLSGTQEKQFVELDRTCGECIFIGEYVIPKGCELVIREGVRVVFGLRSGLTVLGKLAVLGTDESPVILKGNGSGLNAWTGIKVARSENVQISYAHISGAIIALSVDASSLRVANSTFYRNTQVGEIRERGGDVSFTDCMMTENVKGVHYHYSKVGFEHCSFQDNKEYAITGSYYGDIVLEGCVIVRNGFGIQDGGYEGTLQAHNCTICDNRKFDVSNSSSVPADLTKNWWGKKNLALLQRTSGSGVRLPKVKGQFANIAEFLTEVPADCGARGCPSKTLK